MLGRAGRLFAENPGTPEFVTSYNEAIARKREVPSGSLLGVLQQYQQSDAFQGLAVSTRRSYVALIHRIERRFERFFRRCPVRPAYTRRLHELARRHCRSFRPAPG